jgi:hypothetical protein
MMADSLVTSSSANLPVTTTTRMPGMKVEETEGGEAEGKQEIARLLCAFPIA